MKISKLGHAVQKNTHKLTKQVLAGIAEATRASEDILSGITELTEQEFSDTLKMARLAEGKTGKALNAIETIPNRNEITEAVSASTKADNTISFNNFFKQAKAGLNIEDRAGAEAEAQALESERINRIMSSEGEAPEIINQTNRATSTSNSTAKLHMTAGEQNYYNPEWSVTEAGLVSQGKMTPNEVAKERSSRRKNMFDKDFEKRALQKQRNEFNFDESRFDVLDENSSDTPWSSTAKAALGTAVAGGALMAALSSSRGQQNNAQLYGQQPLY